MQGREWDFSSAQLSSKPQPLWAPLWRVFLSVCRSVVTKCFGAAAFWLKKLGVALEGASVT